MPPPPVLDERDQELLRAADAARDHAYAPYSGLRVGAALRTVSGHVFTGCNIENGSFSLTICAERVAVFSAVAALGSTARIEALAVSADAPTCPPCGACRQVVLEFGEDTRVIFPHEGEVTVAHLSELLPFGFSLS